MGEDINEAEIDFVIEDFFKFENICFIFIICWVGKVCFFVIDVINDDAPNNPVNNGRKGSFKFKFRVAIPRNPANKNITNAHSLFSFSEKTR